MNKRIKQTLGLVLGVLLWTLVDLHATAHAQSEQNISAEFPAMTTGLANLFSIDRPVLLRGLSSASLTLAQYHEQGSLVAVVIAETSSHLYVYLEHCDLCAVLTRGNKQTGAIEILHQSHELTCPMLRQDLLSSNVSDSICN